MMTIIITIITICNIILLLLLLIIIIIIILTIIMNHSYENNHTRSLLASPNENSSMSPTFSSIRNRSP